MTETGYKTRDILLEENKGLLRQVRDLQEKLQVAHEGLQQSEQARVAALENVDQVTEALEGAQGRLDETEEALRLSDQVRIGCPENHPFKPEGKLQRGHVHMDKNGHVTVWCNRGHFDRWYEGE